MKQSFLNSLLGLPVQEATKLIEANGLTIELVPEKCVAVTLQARRKTVIVFQKEGIVSETMSGDGLELERDVPAILSH